MSYLVRRILHTDVCEGFIKAISQLRCKPLLIFSQLFDIVDPFRSYRGPARHLRENHIQN